MFVSPVQSSRARPADRKTVPNDPNQAPPPSTALVPVTPAPAAPRISGGGTRPDPAFVAHLIAVAQQAPQTRTLRRASPEEAQTHYRAQPLSAAAHGLRMSKTI